MSDPGIVQLVEGLPQTPSGTPLPRALMGVRNPLAEVYRALAWKVASLATRRFTTIGAVSAVRGEGKTTVALGLAAALARLSHHRVLLLEADLHEPSLEAYLGLPRMSGVSEWLSGRTATVPVRTVSPPGFAFISAGRKPLIRSDLTRSDRMGALLGACQLSFGFVVVDCPPLDTTDDAVALQDLLDGFLLVVRARTAREKVIARAAERLEADRIQGVIFNDRPEALPGQSGHAYR
jgi:succinoglycan biosynthesis transport protein ExoP